MRGLGPAQGRAFNSTYLASRISSLQGVQEANRATRVFQNTILNLYHTLQAAVPLPAHTLGGLLLSLADPADPGRPLPRARLLAELSNLFVAGADTTGHTMSWALVRRAVGGANAQPYSSCSESESTQLQKGN